MKTSDGQMGVVPANRVPEAAKSGLQIVPLSDQETQHPGFWHELYSDLAMPKVTRSTNPKLAEAMPGANMPEYVGAVGTAAAGAMAAAATEPVWGSQAAATIGRALKPIAQKYGIKALEGAGLAFGWHLYRDLHDVFGGDTR